MTLSLLETVRLLIEKTYGTRTGVADMASFIIGDDGYWRLSGRHSVLRSVGAAAPPAAGPRVLVRDAKPCIALAVYFPDSLIARLEQHPPCTRLDDGNVDDFADFIEEIDHFVVLAHGLSTGREMNLLELEIRANVTKALVLSHYLGRQSGRGSLDDGQRLWVRYHLFEKRDFCEPDPALMQRYTEARRFAVRILDRLQKMPVARRLKQLRRWNRLPAPAKLRDLAAA